MPRPEDISSASSESFTSEQTSGGTIGQLEKLTHSDGTPTFGELLVAFKDQIAVRQSTEFLQAKFISARVVEALVDQKYGMTSGSFSLLEQSKTLPRVPRKFISAIGKIFDLNSGELWLLLQSYQFDHSVRNLDPIMRKTKPAVLTRENLQKIRNGERLSEMDDPEIRRAMEALKNEVPSDRERRHASIIE